MKKELLKISTITIIVYLVFRYLLYLVYPFLIAFGLAVLLNPWVERLQRRIHVKRGVLSALLVTATFGLIAGSLVGLVYACVTQGRKFANSYQVYITRGVEFWHVCCDKVEAICGFRIEETMPDVLGYSFSYLKNIFVILGVIVVIIVSSTLLLSDYPSIKVKILNNSFGKAAYDIGVNMKKAGGAYLKAQLIILLIVTVICCVGLFLTGNRYAILLGCVIGICDLMPFLGTGTILFPWLVVELFLGKYVPAIAYAVIYLVCNFTREFLEPKLLGNKLQVSPIWILITTYVGLCLFGGLGFFLGPTAGLLIMEIYKATNKGNEKGKDGSS